MPNKPLVPAALKEKLRALLTAQRSTTDIPVEMPARAERPARPSPVDEAVEMIAKYEGFREKAYRDPRGKPTIGYGQATPDVRMGMRTTEPEARKFLEERVRADSANLAGRNVPISAGLLSAAYNLGRGNLGEYGILSALRGGDYEEAAKILETAVRAKGRTLPGLVKRRKEEAENIRQSRPVPQNIIGLR